MATKDKFLARDGSYSRTCLSLFSDTGKRRWEKKFQACPCSTNTTTKTHAQNNGSSGTKLASFDGTEGTSRTNLHTQHYQSRSFAVCTSPKCDRVIVCRGTWVRSSLLKICCLDDKSTTTGTILRLNTKIALHSVVRGPIDAVFAIALEAPSLRSTLAEKGISIARVSPLSFFLPFSF